jgi:hypothetical protein
MTRTGSILARVMMCDGDDDEYSLSVKYASTILGGRRSIHYLTKGELVLHPNMCRY